MMRTMRVAVFAAVLAASLVGCVGASPSLEPSPSPASVGSNVASLRYALVEELGPPLFCDPDFYPVARDDEAKLATERLPAIRADAATYDAITAQLDIDPESPSPDQVLAIYREWKMLDAIALTPIGAAYGFDFIAATGPDASDGWHVIGTIGADGMISLERKDPSGPPPCPICLARGTRIATPSGDVAVEDVVEGMAVWTTDPDGHRVVDWVIAVGSTPVLSTHHVVHLVLADGRTLDASPGHPLPDGRHIGDLRAGDLVDGARVESADLDIYRGGATFDLRPSGPTGTYWGNGILLASTIALSATTGR
jgi:Hint domain